MKKSFLCLLTSCLLFSCSEEDNGQMVNREENETVRVSFSVEVESMDLVGEPEPAVTRATVNESKVYAAYMFQFNGTEANSTIVKRGEAISITNGQLMFDLELETDDQVNRVYLLANVTADDEASLPPVGTTLADFQSTVISFTNEGIYSSELSANNLPKKGIPMIGYKDITPSQITEADLLFSMKRMAAKVTLNVSKDIDIEFYSVQLKNVAVGTRIEAPVGEYPGAISTNFLDYDVDEIKSSGSKYSFNWYIPENRQGENSSITLESQKGGGECSRI